MKHQEKIVGMIAFKNGVQIGSCDLFQPWRPEWSNHTYVDRNLKLGGELVEFGGRFRSLAELRRWFAVHGADTVHVVHQMASGAASRGTPSLARQTTA